MNFTFRQPTINDLEQLQKYINKLSSERTFIRKQGDQISREDEEKYLKDFLEKIEKRKAIKLLAFDGNVLAGVADVRLDFGSMKHVGIFGITVAKDYRSKGLGSELMKRTIELGKEYLDGLEIISLGVFADNKIAISLYKKFGFKQYGVLPKGVIRNGKHSDHVFMYLDVTNHQQNVL